MTNTATTADLMDAARAAGIDLDVRYNFEGCLVGMWIEGDGKLWHPLTNSDQLWLLAEKCGMEIDFDNEKPRGSIRLSIGIKILWPSTAPDFRHAIVIAAARYWRARNA